MIFKYIHVALPVMFVSGLIVIATAWYFSWFPQLQRFWGEAISIWTGIIAVLVVIFGAIIKIRYENDR